MDAARGDDFDCGKECDFCCVDGLIVISGAGLILSESEADFVGVEGFSFSAGFVDTLRDTARTAADFGGG